MLKQINCMAFFCMALVLSGAAHANLQDRIGWQPSLATIKKIESQLKLPKSAYSLKRYKRFYAGEIVDGKKVIVGIFLFNGKVRGVEITDLLHMPVVFDGGCSVLDFKFLIDENQVALLECHGEA
jgi:hypothetical protein